MRNDKYLINYVIDISFPNDNLDTGSFFEAKFYVMPSKSWLLSFKNIDKLLFPINRQNVNLFSRYSKFKSISGSFLTSVLFKTV